MQVHRITTALLTPSLVAQGTTELGAVAGDAASIGMLEEQQLNNRTFFLPSLSWEQQQACKHNTSQQLF